MMRFSNSFKNLIGGEIMAKRKLLLLLIILTVALLLSLTTTVFAEEKPSAEAIAIDTVWTMVAAFLVFWMQAGFAMLEGGLTRAKNIGNIMMKNLMDFSMSSLAYWAFGFALMFGAGNALFGASGWFLNVTAGQVDKVFPSLSWTNVPLMAKFLFQMVFAGTAATIVSGAMAERTKFHAYLIYSVIISGFIYPIVGHWIWGGGWLAELGFLDFAGSTVVHGTGGWAALAGLLVLGPRIGKYGKNGKINPIPGHNMSMAMLGVFILWLGWYGFNAGSTMGAMGLSFTEVAATTTLGGAAAAITGMFTAWKITGKPDVALTGGSAIAGLVAITAPTAFVENWAAILIGLIAGLLYILLVLLFDKLKLDDPVGAIPAHGLLGAWGTLSVGIFASPRLIEAAGAGKAGLLYTGNFAQLGIQAIGIIAVFAFVFVSSSIVFRLIKATVGLRVTEEEEIQGLDIGEHGMWGYPEQFAGHLPPTMSIHYPDPNVSVEEHKRLIKKQTEEEKVKEGK